MDVTRTAHWLAALQALLPPGLAITKEPDANLTKLLEALGAMLGDGERNLDEWLEQYEPAVATTMLTDWERLLGLPDCCDAGLVLSLAQRRANVLEKLTVIGGQSPQYYIDLMARRGIAITVQELGLYVWHVTAPMINLHYFRAGEGRCGDRLRTWGDPAMECRIQRLKPAHTRVLFGYQ
jgi:uncharacterized protein YmfQ (DUF2313 family)